MSSVGCVSDGVAVVSRSVTSLGNRNSIPLFTGSHEWVIVDFHERNDGPSVSLNTRFGIPVTDPHGNKMMTQWRIKCYPNGCDQENANNISLFVNQVSGPLFFVKYTFSINGIPPYTKTPVPQHIRSGTVQFSPDKRYSARGWKRYISTDNVKNNSTFLQNGNLVIACKLELEYRDSVITSPTTKSFFTSPSSSFNGSPKNDFDIESDIKYTDLILRCNNDIEYKCHKFILAKYSDVFDAMFSHDFEENKSNKVVISDLDPIAIGEMIRYVYSGTVKGLKKINKNLLTAADKYNIQDLKATCEKSLVESMNVNNVCSLLLFANDRNSEYLKSKSIQFITHHVQKVTTTEGWTELMNSETQLVTEVIRQMGPKDSTIDFNPGEGPTSFPPPPPPPTGRQ